LRNEYNSAGTLAQRLARAGLLKFFPLALSHTGKIDAATTLNFAKTENWELFQLCIQYITQPNLDILTIVVEKGFLACLQQLHQICVSKAETSGQSVAGTRHYSPSSADLSRLAARAQQWECVRFLITHGCPMNKSLTTHLVQAGQLELYHLAIAHGCGVSVQAACQFARDGNVECLQHALDHGCERSEEILRAAARHGQLQCLMFTHAQGCPLSAQVTLAAARGGHQACLQYLNEHGCPSHARAEAFKRKHSILD